ncbi:YtoQ family protein [Vreelandella sulfidaeris]
MILCSEDIINPLKEVDGSAKGLCTAFEQVVETLKYVLKV